jgi:hypothetical protein
MRNLVQMTGRLMIAGCLGLVTLEVAARIDDWLRFGADPLAYYGPKSLLVTDDAGLTTNRPLARFEKWQHDARGYRTYAGSMTTGFSARWTCLGSSESYGLYEKPGGEWPAVLGNLVAREKIRVDNASVVGMSPFELPRYIDRHIMLDGPDLVILVISPFSYTQAMASGTPPDSAHFADPARIERMRTARAPTLRECSRFLPKAQASILRRFPPDWTRRLAIATKERKLARLERAGTRPDQLRDSPPPETVAAYVATLAQLQRQLADRGVALAVCTYATSLSLDRTLAARDAMLDRTLSLPSYSPAGLCRIAADFAAATRAYCDTSQAVLIDFEAALPKDAETFADSVHLTDAGAKRAASVAFAALHERPVGRPTASP